jgi:serine/threonine protein kinase
MEYAGDGCNLSSYIKLSRENETKSGDCEITEEKVKDIMKQLLKGLEYIHSKNVCHRDIKPTNIFLTSDLKQLKILDFNVALRFTPGQKMFGVTGEE